MKDFLTALTEIVKAYPLFQPVYDDTASPTQQEVDHRVTLERAFEAGKFTAYLYAELQKLKLIFGSGDSVIHWCGCKVVCLQRIHEEALCPTCYECRNKRDEADQKAALDK